MPRGDRTVAAHQFHAGALRVLRPHHLDGSGQPCFVVVNPGGGYLGGDRYELDVTVEGEIDPETGYVLDLKELKELVEARVIRDVDHRNLNLDVPWMKGANPTTENLVVRIWERLVDAFPEHVRLVRLVLWETPRNYVEYSGG